MKIINILINMALAVVIVMHIIILSDEHISIDTYNTLRSTLILFTLTLIIVDIFWLADYLREKNKPVVIDTGWLRRAMKTNPHKNDIVRENLMTQEGYVPYCGNHKCISMPRTYYKDGQFECPACNFRSEFPIEFIREYKKKWGID